MPPNEETRSDLESNAHSCLISKGFTMASYYAANFAKAVPFEPWNLIAVAAGYAAMYVAEHKSFFLGCHHVPFKQLKLDLREGFEEVHKNLKENLNALKINLGAVGENLDAIHILQKEMEEAFKKLGNQLANILFELYQNFYAILDANQNVQRNYEAIRKSMNDIDRNYDGILDNTAQREKLFQTVERGFMEVNKMLSQTNEEMMDWFDKLGKLLRGRRKKNKTSELHTFMREFAEIMEDLGQGDPVAKLTGDNGYHVFLKHGKTPKSSESLHTLLNDILKDGRAIPNDADDDTAFATLRLLCSGTDTYLRMFDFVMLGYALLAQENYGKSDVRKYNEIYRESVKVFQEFRENLNGVGSQIGLISEVIHVLKQVKGLHFMKDVPHISAILSQKIKDFRDMKARIAEMVFGMDDQPSNVIRCELDSSVTSTPHWQLERKVRYAIQYLVNGTFSQVSQWSVPCTSFEKARLKLDIGTAPSGTTRVIFRRFDHDDPQVVGIVYDHQQTEFRDVDRDLYDAILEGNQRLARMNAGELIDCGANVTATFENGKQAIHAATEAGNVQVLHDLLGKGADINTSDGAGYTPLHVAAESGDESLVHGLIGLGANVQARSLLNWTAFHVAAKQGHVETLKVLLQADKIDPNARTVGGFTPLHLAVSSRRKNAVKLMISNEKSDVNAQSDKLLTPLHLAVLGLDGGMVRLLLKNTRCNVNIGAHGGLTALHLAAISGDENIVDQLVKHNKTDINANSDKGWSSLHFAISLKKDGVIRRLLQASKISVNIDDKDKSNGQWANISGQELDLINQGAQMELKGSYVHSSPHKASDKVSYLPNQEQEIWGSLSAGNSTKARSTSNFSPEIFNAQMPAQMEESSALPSSRRGSFKVHPSLLGTGRQVESAVPSQSSLPSTNDNILLAKWLFHMFGRRSFVKGMKKVESRAGNRKMGDNVHSAERLLRQGMERYGQLK